MDVGHGGRGASPLPTPPPSPRASFTVLTNVTLLPTPHFSLAKKETAIIHSNPNPCHPLASRGLHFTCNTIRLCLQNYIFYQRRNDKC